MGDRVGDSAQRLLGTVLARLDDHAAPVCRAFLAPGAAAPWDTCCDCPTGEGQAWVAIERVYPAGPFPNEDAGAHRCAPNEYGANLTVGVLRCAAVVDDHGRAPTGERVTADGEKVARDRALVRDAILCDYLAPDDDPGSFRMGGWDPLGPAGGCVGGRWRLTVAVGSGPWITPTQ